MYPNKTYEIRLSGKEGNSWYYDMAHLYPYFTQKQEEIKNVEVNEKEVDGNLYFEIR